MLISMIIIMIKSQVSLLINMNKTIMIIKIVLKILIPSKNLLKNLKHFSSKQLKKQLNLVKILIKKLKINIMILKFNKILTTLKKRQLKLPNK
jgi:hypothetical protein